jgi:hypothetical protein
MKAGYLSLLTLVFALNACDFDSKLYQPASIAVTGKVGEILVVCDQDLWDSEIKPILDSNLTQFIMPYFPDVATFDLIHKTPAHFTEGVKRYRNTLFLSIDPKLTGDKGKIEKRIGVWATDQLVIEVIGKDYNQLVETCKYGLKNVHDEFDTMEWERILKYYKQTPNGSIDQALKKNFGIKMALPDASKLVTSRPNFFRIEFPSAARPIEFVGSGQQDAGTIFSGLTVYQYDYMDSSQFSMENLLQARDTMLKYNVPYSYEGMYMGTQYVKMVYPQGNPSVNQSGKLKVFEMRGMFVFTGLGKHGPGGCFWSYHFIQPKRKKLVCVSGYVDAPSTASWTQPLREVEAILKSVEID